MVGARRIAGGVVVLVAIAITAWLVARGTARTPAERLEGPGEHGGHGGEANLTGGGDPTFYDGGRIERTIADRRVRDELRRRILAGWAMGEGEAAEAAKQGRFEPMPPGKNGEYVDPAYIQQVIRSDMFPMARGCYDDLLKRQPDAGGRVEIFFKIVGDDKLGGLVDEVELDASAPRSIRDERMNTCIRESMLSLAFRPPPGDGVVTIGYPIEFGPSEPDD